MKFTVRLSPVSSVMTSCHVVGARLQRQVGQIVDARPQLQPLHGGAVDLHLDIGRRARSGMSDRPVGRRLSPGANVRGECSSRNAEQIGLGLEARALRRGIAELQPQLLVRHVVDGARASPLEAVAMLDVALRFDRAAEGVDRAVVAELVLEHDVAEPEHGFGIQPQARCRSFDALALPAMIEPPNRLKKPGQRRPAVRRRRMQRVRRRISGPHHRDIADRTLVGRRLELDLHHAADRTSRRSRRP